MFRTVLGSDQVNSGKNGVNRMSSFDLIEKNMELSHIYLPVQFFKMQMFQKMLEKCLHFKTWMLLEEKPQKHAASWMYCHPGLINSAASNCKHDSGGKQPIDMMMILTP